MKPILGIKDEFCPRLVGDCQFREVPDFAESSLGLAQKENLQTSDFSPNSRRPDENSRIATKTPNQKDQGESTMRLSNKEANVILNGAKRSEESALFESDSSSHLGNSGTQNDFWDTA
jgi:hypothetical protein